MKSPFPGMDPYIEEYDLWRDFHNDLIAEIKRTLAPVLPERYYVELEDRSYVLLAGVDGKEEKPFYPDVGVRTSQPEPKADTTAAKKQDVLFKPDDALTANELCVVLLKRHLQNDTEAVDAFEEMKRKHPTAPCVFWNLGRKYERLGRNRQALMAYKRYIELDPQASQRETIERKTIPNLEAKLRQ